MNKKFKHILIAIGLLSNISNSNASIVTWTFDNISFERNGFASYILNGTLGYDVDTNTFSNSTLVGFPSNTIGGTNAIVLNNTSNANGLSFSNALFPSGSLTYLTPLTNSGGTVFLSSGDFSAGSSVWSLRAEQSITGIPTTSAIPEPETYAMMLAGIGLAGFAARRKTSK